MAARAKRTKTTAEKVEPAASEPRDMHGRFNDQSSFLFKRAMSKLGAPRIYEDPMELAKDVQEYFDWAKRQSPRRAPQPSRGEAPSADPRRHVVSTPGSRAERGENGARTGQT
jgi:hypothetical protein